MCLPSIEKRVHHMHVFAINRVIPTLLRTRDCASNSSDIAGKLASLRVWDVCSQTPLVFGNSGFEKYDFKMGISSIFYISSITYRLSFSYITDRHCLLRVGLQHDTNRPFFGSRRQRSITNLAHYLPKSKHVRSFLLF